MARIAYLGPPGTFTEQATRSLTAEFDAELVTYDTVANALDAVRDGDVLAAGVPVENSVEGSVPATMDALVTGAPLVGTREAMLPVEFDLLARPGVTGIDEIGTVSSHPHAIAQVRGWLRENLPTAQVQLAGSTAAGAADAAAGRCDAAIAAPLARELYPELDRLRGGIADVADAVTRFLLVQSPGAVPGTTGADRTSVAAVIADEVGSLSDLLGELSLRDINLSRIESRPTKDQLGEYRFFLDFDGHVADARIGDALTALRRRCTEVRFLGSYPKADRSPSAVHSWASEQAFRSSAEWLDDVRAGRSA